jgi:hypothetical protein
MSGLLFHAAVSSGSSHHSRLAGAPSKAPTHERHQPYQTLSQLRKNNKRRADLRIRNVIDARILKGDESCCSLMTRGASSGRCGWEKDGRIQSEEDKEKAHPK